MKIENVFSPDNQFFFIDTKEYVHQPRPGKVRLIEWEWNSITGFHFRSNPGRKKKGRILEKIPKEAKEAINRNARMIIHQMAPWLREKLKLPGYLDNP
jgi:hypothetical protein